MKFHFLILVMILAIIAARGGAQQTQEPLGKDQLMDLVKAGMEPADLIKLIHEHGVDFDLTDEILKALRDSGVQAPVIDALRAARPKPLTKDQILQLVAGHVPSERAAMLVKQRGIDFVADERYLQTLSLAGGDDTLIAELRESSKAVTGDLVVVTSPYAEVFLDFELQGRSNAQGSLEVKAKPGTHALKITHTGKKAYEQSVTITGRQTTKIEAQMADLEASLGQVHENPKDNLKYVWLPPGIFTMGCSPGDNECVENEKPAHQVTITHGFWLGQTEVTVVAYRKFAQTMKAQMPPPPNFNPGWNDSTMPIVNTPWDDARAYCRWIGGRLPTEAEWEYAARAGSTVARYGPIDEIAWYSGNSGGRTLEVAQKRPNAWNLFDMLGNVYEWVSDWYGGDYYPASPERDPQGPDNGRFHVVRGGSWRNVSRESRASMRGWYVPGVSEGDGFRCVQEVRASPNP